MTADDAMGSGSGSGSGTLEPPVRGFQIKTPDVTIHAGEEITYCYYFKTTNTEAMTIKRWQSAWTAGSHHVILFTTPTLAGTEGAIEPHACGFGGGISNLPSWTYSAQTSPSDMAMPADDGNGVPVGMDIAAHQAAYLEIHYNNIGDEDVMASATINAEAYDAGTVTTKTFAYVTYRSGFTIPGSAQNFKVTNTCNIPAASKVWLMTTHAHKQAVKTRVLNGTTASTDLVFESTSWEHPGAKRMDNPYYQFGTGKLTNECTYNNPTATPIEEGSSAKTEEMCMASGYIFPATKSTICYDGYVF